MEISFLIFVYIIFTPIIYGNEDSSKDYLSLYLNALDSKRSGDSISCAGLFSKAQALYQSTVDNAQTCSNSCLSPDFDIPSIAYIECLHLCALNLPAANGLRKSVYLYVFGRRSLQSTEAYALQSFLDGSYRKPLASCLYARGNTREAVSQLFTYTLSHPLDSEAATELKTYENNNGIPSEWFVDLSAKSFRNSFREGVRSYENSDWPSVLEHMEHTAKNFIDEVSQCIAACPLKYITMTNSNPQQTYLQVILDSHRNILQCQRDCPADLATPLGKDYTDFVPLVFHYSQFNFYKTSQLQKAARSVGTYLLLKPNDEEMLKNKLYYVQQPGITEQDFLPFEYVVEYARKLTAIEAAISRISSMTNTSDNLLHRLDQRKPTDSSERPSVPDYSGNQIPFYYDVDSRSFLQSPRNVSETFKGIIDRHDIQLVMQEQELNGPDRFAAHNVALPAEQQLLLSLAHTGATQGDGYAGQEQKTSPHTNYELFKGLTVGSAVEMAERHKIRPESVRAYLDVSERARTLVESYFALPTPLYFAFTHLVCRSALDEKKIERSDLSHPIHADNCHIQPDGSCPRRRPAYIERDYSAIVYLSDDFDGGEFIFSFKNQTYQSLYNPIAGSMVGFHSSNYHGVKAVLRGERCAVALWFTLDPNFREKARDDAWVRINKLNIGPEAPPVLDPFNHEEL